MFRGRTSHEVRGLKYYLLPMLCSLQKSHLTRGAWIEMNKMHNNLWSFIGRTSHEVRGLKFTILYRI